jgi:hypothetical protein
MQNKDETFRSVPFVTIFNHIIDDQKILILQNHLLDDLDSIVSEINKEIKN